MDDSEDRVFDRHDSASSTTPGHKAKNILKVFARMERKGFPEEAPGCLFGKRPEFSLKSYKRHGGVFARMLCCPLDCNAALQRPGKRGFIGILEIRTHRQTTGDAGDLANKGFEELGEIQRRCFALHIGIHRQDDFID